MKNNYFFKTFIALFITVNVMAQNVPNYVPTNGLVGWWPFNGNANDESGNGNHGTVNGATLTADRNGKANSAFSFYDIDDFIEIQTQNGRFNNQQYTLVYWFRTNQEQSDINGGSNTNPAIISRLDAGGPSAVNPDWIDNFVIYEIGGSNHFNTPVNGGATGGNTTLGNIWNNITFSVDNDSTFTYLNGNKIYSNKNSGIITFKNFPIRLGRSKFTYWKDFSGELDDIAIYNRALTQEEITALYTSTPPCTNPSAVITPQGNTTFCQGGFVNLNASTGANYTYEWYNNGQLINGATASVYQATASGNYTVKVIDGACDATSTATTVTVNPNPTAIITPQGNTTFCQGGFVNLVASGGSSYQWNTGSSAATISATQSGTYTVNVFNSFGCQATASQQVTVNPLPNVTLNALNQFTLKNATPIQLVASPTGGTFSGEGVQGATFNPANVTLGKKTITYNYTSPQGCSGQALINTIIADTLGNVCSTYDTLKVKFKLTTGIKAGQLTSMNVYPNPTSDVIIIEASNVTALNGYSYKLIDVQGKEVYNALVTNVKTEISMKTFGKAGVYILQVVDANNVSIETKQIVLE